MTIIELPALDAPEVVHRAPAKGRILDTANRLFYEDGIRNVGVDRIISASSVTKATFYKHYRAKDNLIVEYILRRHRTERAGIKGVIDAHPDSPRAALEGIVALVVEVITSDGFRGCPFINAAAEFTDAAHPVRMIVTAHREWYVETVSALLKADGHPAPGDAADELLLARDGAMAGGYAGDSIAATTALVRMTNRVLRESELIS